MKRIIKLSFVAVFAAIAGYSIYANKKVNPISNLTLSNLDALASGESWDCPNGCVDNGSGCFCHYWFPTYREYDWG